MKWASLLVTLTAFLCAVSFTSRIAFHSPRKLSPGPSNLQQSVSPFDDWVGEEDEEIDTDIPDYDVG